MTQQAILTTRRYTVAEYFEIDTASPDHKYEYRDGELLDMAGGSESHGLIAGNIITSQNKRLADTPCRVYGSDARVQVHRSIRYVYPDASVIECYHRQGDGSWSFTCFEGTDATARLRSLQIDLPLSEVYAKVDFPSPPPQPTAQTPPQ